ncbi:MAG: DVUA0089 family protein, partial [Myxococcales bacterium]|nr:DVUA0089 family protein [Myxococcales bacterium]
VYQQVDESEPNDDAATAQVLTTSGAPVVGMVSPAGDEDWYAVTVPAGGWIRAWTDDGAGACPFDTYMTLTSTDGVTRLAFDDDDGVGTCSFLQPGAIDPGAANLPAGTYFVRVRAYSSSVTGTYVLHVEFGGPGCGNSIIEPSEQCDDGNTAAGDGCDAQCTYEPNGTFTAPGAPQLLSLGAIDPASEVITVRVDVAADAYLFAETFTSTAPAGCNADTRMRLYAADGVTQLGEDDADGIGSCSLFDPNTDAFAQLAAGTYWVTVEEDGRNATIASVFLAIEATPVGQCGNRVVEGTEQCDDGNGQAGDGCDATCVIEPAGIYAAPGGPQTFAMMSIDPIGEQDLYRIDVSATAYLRAETFVDSVAGTCDVDTYIRLFDSAGTQLGIDDDGGVGACSLIDPNTDGFARLDPGTYWLQVEEYGNNGLIARYDVVFSSVAADVCGNGVLETALGEACDDGNTTLGDGCSPTCQVEGPTVVDTEPNDDAANAVVITTSGTLGFGSVSPAGDEDWYAVTVPAGGWIRAWTDDGAGACPFDTFLTLTSTDGATLAASDDDDGVGSCSFIRPGTLDRGAANLVAGTYYVRVRAYSATATGNYVLHVEFGAPACGNQVEEVGEQCDDGNTVAGDGCDASCAFEPAFSFTAPGAVQVVDLGSIDPASEVIAIRINVSTDAYLFAETLTSTAPEGCTSDTRMRLYAADGTTQLGEDDADGVNSCSGIYADVDGFAALSAGTYWLTIEEDNRDATVASLFAGLFATPVGQCGNFVVEGTEQCDDGNGTAGDGCDATCQIEPVGVYTAPGQPQTFAGQSIDPVGEQDLYRIDVTATTYVRVETFDDATAGTCGIDTVIRLFDNTGTEVGVDDEGGLNSCSLIDPSVDTFARLAPGTYWLQVEDYLNNSLIPNYDVVFSSAPVDVCGNGVTEPLIGENCDDGNTTAGDGCDATCRFEGNLVLETEPNGDATTANASGLSALGSQTVGGVIAAGGDADWWSFVVPAGGGTVDLLTYGTLGSPTVCGGIDTEIWLYDSTGTQLANNDDIGFPNYCSALTNGPLAAGTYYVRVEYYDPFGASSDFAYYMDITLQ